MFRKKISALVLTAAVVVGALATGCNEDSNYDQRAVVYVESINDNAPFFCDVLNQGDSTYYTPPPENNIKYIDDYVVENFIKVRFYNRPYSQQISTCASSLGDFMVTDYEVRFTDLAGGPDPVPAFSGRLALEVPCNEAVETYILLVPFSAKNQTPLDDLKYTANEIMSHAHFIFYGHEIQTDRRVSIEAGLTVNFADPLIEGKTDDIDQQ